MVLPLIESEVVIPGWLSEHDFIAAYGAAQDVPGPLFAFSAYLGAIAGSLQPNGWVGAGIALDAIYLQSFLLLACSSPRSTSPSGPARSSSHRTLPFGLVAFGLLAAWHLPASSFVLVAALGH